MIANNITNNITNQTSNISQDYFGGNMNENNNCTNIESQDFFNTNNDMNGISGINDKNVRKNSISSNNSIDSYGVIIKTGQKESSHSHNNSHNNNHNNTTILSTNQNRHPNTNTNSSSNLNTNMVNDKKIIHRLNSSDISNSNKINKQNSTNSTNNEVNKRHQSNSSTNSNNSVHHSNRKRHPNSKKNRPFKDTLKPNSNIPETIMESDEENFKDDSVEIEHININNTQNIKNEDNLKIIKRIEYKKMIFQDMSEKTETLKQKEGELQNYYKDV